MRTPQTPNRKKTARSSSGYAERILSDLIVKLGPGARLPNHPELMSSLQLSERAVLAALTALHTQGRITRRPGAGTFVAEHRAGPPAEPRVPLASAGPRTVVGVFSPDDSFFDYCVKVLHGQSHSESLDLICRIIDPRLADEFTLPAEAGGPVGFVVFRSDLHGLAKKLQAAGNRVVMIGAPLQEQTDVPNIYNSHEHGGYLAIRHLIDLGHRTIAAQSLGLNRPDSMRRRGHQRAVREAIKKGLDVQLVYVEGSTINQWTPANQGARSFFLDDSGPTAIAAWNDREAMKIMRLLQESGMRVPEDVSIVGYDALPDTELVYPSLASIDQAIEHQVREALAILQSPEAPGENHVVVVLPALRTGASAAPPHSGTRMRN